MANAKIFTLQEDNGRTEFELVLQTHMQTGHFGMDEVRKLLGLPPSKNHPTCHSCEMTRGRKS